MILKISPTRSFVKQAKRLAKKYRNLSADLKLLNSALEENPKAGTEIINNCFKIRLANSSTKAGKSGGFRVIYYFISEDSHIYLLSIYSKTEQSSVDEAMLKELIIEAFSDL